jgi:hypothetical protein
MMMMTTMTTTTISSIKSPSTHKVYHNPQTRICTAAAVADSCFIRAARMK